MTQIGLMLEGQNGLNWTRWKNILQTAEDFGFKHVFRSDHYTNPNPPDLDSLELWTSLTYAASHTSTIEFGPLVTPVTFRHPTMNARYAAAIDDLSNGRFTMGMGAGWQDREHNNFGVPFYDFPTRYAMLTEALDVVTSLFYNDEPTTYAGEHFSLEDAILLPRPARRIPMLIGGNGPKRTLPLVAKYADEWNAVFIPRETYAERTPQLDALLKAEGRQASDVRRSLMTQLVFAPDDASLQAQLTEKDSTAEDLIDGYGIIVGTASAVVDQIGSWAELGVERFMLQWLDLDNIADLELIARDVLPHFHK